MLMGLVGSLSADNPAATPTLPLSPLPVGSTGSFEMQLFPWEKWAGWGGTM